MTEPPIIRRRAVFCIGGYEPRSAKGFHRRFRRELRRFSAVWGLRSSASDCEHHPQARYASWVVDCAGNDWTVETNYYQLDWSDIVASRVSQPLWRRALRNLLQSPEIIARGLLFAIQGVHWRLVVTILLPHVAGLLAIAITSILAYAALRAGSAAGIGLSSMLAVIVGLSAFFLLVQGTRPAMLLRLADATSWQFSFAAGKSPETDERIDHFARLILSIVERGRYDEIIFVGHSTGTAMVVVLLDKILRLDADFVSRAQHISVIGAGANRRAIALQGKANAVRFASEALAAQPNLTWVEVFTHKDPLCALLKPSAATEGAVTQTKPESWHVFISSMLTQRTYQRFRFNYLRLHYQYVMANEMRNVYDFFGIVCGPAPLAAWLAARYDLDNPGRPLRARSS